MAREELIVSAVSFLQDPSVANAPLEKRISFLQSKNLTQEEIDLALARAADDAGHPSSPAPQQSAPSGYAPAYRQPAQAQAYGPPPGYWQPPPPPEPPKRDWRDYFIMATVMGGVGYGLYFTAKRYILPLIAPPTPPQLEQDKKSIDESFKRAFDLLEQLNEDTTALKASEEARTTRLDSALGELEGVLSGLKESSKRQGEDNRRMEDDVRGLRDLIPKAMDAQKEANDVRLKELSTELKSLKTLVGNRMSPAAPRPATTTPGYYGTGLSQPANPNVVGTPTTASPAPTPALTPAPQPTTILAPADQLNTPSATESQGNSATAATPAVEKPVLPYSRSATGRAAIPAWQMAANKKNDEAKKDTSTSGTVTDASASTEQ